ncbi:probable serine/threonine-protein kinase DDB_G0283337 isoform X2 [Phymastichus coffea]|uniref:probable serine/threonine-protein kinase DDB_G0283337 isoform X2 n=1 Tax=Phymastichus coffea TaxID=108790 RepID=UPI00273AEAE3|nr:probable serine/threonine-protein kinase DDB_G0283337 isoform X2 [Phymastichus coffea]
MHPIQESLKLKHVPTDIWSIREQLCLASSVLKSGDQNWISVSRSLKAVGNKDLNRSSDWFSQKSCAQQYTCLLETVDIPKRKKREGGETTSESIVRRLTQDRIAEISKILSTQRDEYQQLKNEICLLKNGTISLEKLQKMCYAIEQEQKELAHNFKPQLNISTKQINNYHVPILQQTSIQKDDNKVSEFSIVDEEVSKFRNDNDNRKNNVEQSSLLTSLLNSSNQMTQLQLQTQSQNTPTIASLLFTSPKVSLSDNLQNISSQLNQSVCDSISNNMPIIAPTLSKLLEQSTNEQISRTQDIRPSSIESKNLRNATHVQNKRTRLTKLGQENNIQTVQKSESILSQETIHIETDKTTPVSIDNIVQETSTMNKDEINEIIGDIEEIIKEEITSGPQRFSSTLNKIAPIVSSNILPPLKSIERTEPRNVDDSASLSNSPTSEIAIEEIDSSSSNIAKIIGTAVETIEYKFGAFNPCSIKEQRSTFLDDTDNDDKELSVNYVVSQKTPNIYQNYKGNKSDNLESIIKLESDDSKILQTNTILNNVITNKNEIVTEKYSPDNLLINQEKNYGFDSGIISNKEFNNEIDNILEENVPIQQTDKLGKTVISKRLCSDIVEDKNQKHENIFENDNHCHEIISEIKNDDTSDDVAKKVRISDLKVSDSLIQEYQMQENSINSKDIFNNQIELEKKTLLPNDSTILKSSLINDQQISEYSPLIEPANIKIKEEILQDSLDIDEVKENDNAQDYEIATYVKIEQIESGNENTDSAFRKDKFLSNRSIVIKQENIEASEIANDIDDEEPAIGKLQGGRAIKTYSKKQNATIDSETENESSWENADYRAWKKSIMLVYHRLSTNKYASIFLRPITEDQAPGYHSIIFKPMDLSTIKKKIDNGTIRSTSHFQRDVMLMFQNAIMFNKYSTFVHKMTLEMQEECLQHMQLYKFE